MQNKCINCIRLKKDCSFYPVDQQPPHVGRAKASARSSTTSKIGRPSLHSLRTSSSHSRQLSSQQGCPSTNLASVPSVPSVAPLANPTSDRFTPDGKGNENPATQVTGSSQNIQGLIGDPAAGRQYDFSKPNFTNWMQPDITPSPTSTPADLQGVWRSYPEESPLNLHLSLYGHQAPQSSETWSPASETGIPGAMGWPGYPQQHQAQYLMGQPEPIDGRSSIFPDIFPPTVTISMPSIDDRVDSPLHCASPFSLAAGIRPIQQPWQHLQGPTSHPRPPDSYANTGFEDPTGAHILQ